MYDRKAAKEQLRKQQKESAASSSSGFVGVLKGDIPVWKCGAGKHKIDILPFVVGKKHPTLPAGSAAYKLDIWTHYGVGVNNDSYICLNKMFKEYCPICNHRAELQKSGDADEEQIKSLKPKHNTLYNIICYDSPEEEKKGVQVWMVSNWFMESKLMTIAEDDDTGEPILFPDPDEGRRISFSRTGTGKDNTNYTGHKLVERNYKISDKLLNATFSLDELVIIPEEDVVEQAFFGAKKGEGKDRDINDDNDNSSSSNNDLDNMTRKELKVFIEENDLNINAADYDEKADLVADIKEALEAKSDVPVSKGNDDGVTEDDIDNMSRKELKALIDKNEMDIDIDDFETDDLKEEIKKKLFASAQEKDEKKKDGKIICPKKGGIFGETFDKYPECVNDCDYFDACSDKYDEIKEAKKKSSGSKLNRR